MKKIYPLILGLLFLTGYLQIANAQSWTIAVCSSGPPSSTVSSTYGPMYSVAGANATSRHAYIYPASQLTGIVNQTLTNIYFHRGTASGSMAGTPNFKVYLKEVSATDWGSGSLTWATEITGATLVYDGDPASAVGSSSGWKNFAFNITNFFYSGQNLALFVEYTNATASTAITWSYEFTSTCVNTSNSNTTKYSNNTTGTLPVTLASTNYRRPYIGFDGVTSACTNPPTPGTANATPSTTVCQGSSVLLDVTGNSSGAGLTFEWESSLTNSPFTPASISAPAPNAQLTINPTSSLWYRAKIICSGGSPVYSVPVYVPTSPLYPGGTYTINSALPTGSGNFNSFSDAVSAISCGINGPVIFNVAPTAVPFNEQVIIPAIYNTSNINTITFNGNGDTLTFNSTNTNERAVFKLNGADYVTINDLNITATGTYQYGIQILNDADNNTIQNCNILVDVSSTSTANNAGILVNSSDAPAAVTTVGNSGCDSTVIIGNTIIGGYAGIAIVANGATNMVNNSTIANNTVKDFYESGIYLNGNSNTLVEGNDISRPTRTSVTTFRGIYLNGVSLNCKISKNRLHNPFGNSAASTSAAFNIHLNACDATVGNENIISNNVIYDHIGSTGNHNGMLLQNSDNVKVYHNTILLNDVGATCTACAARGIYVQGTTVAGLDFRNNNIAITQGGTAPKQCIFFEPVSVSGYNLNNNNYYISSTGGTLNEVARYGGSSSTATQGNGFTTLVGWQGATGKDDSSVSTDPLFLSVATGDLTPAGTLDNLGTPVGITTDFNGVTRNINTPDIGAYEFTGPSCPTPVVAGNAVTNTTMVCSGSPAALNLSGNTSGSGQLYQWESAPAGSGPWTSISTASTAAGLIINPTATLYYRAQVTCGSSTVPSTPVTVAANPGLAGIYTINAALPTGGTNFESFADAVAGMNCGITAPVTFNVVAGSGPYNEQVSITPISGASATNTVTFNGNGNTLSFNVTASSGSRTGITLDGADHVTINDLIIDGSSGTYAWGVLLTGQADSNVISNCTIDVSKSGTSAGDLAGIVISNSITDPTSAGNNGNYNTITGNTITGGYHGIVAYAGTSSANTNMGNVITNNIIRDVHTYPIYLYYNENALVSGNDISRPTRGTSGTGNGIYISTGCANTLIEKNRIHNLFDAMPSGTSTTYCIYISADGTSGMENKIVNNLIYKIGGDGSIYGIYNTGAAYCQVYHNTISLDDVNATAGLAYGFYQSTSVAGIEFKNNIVSITRGGSGAKYAIYKNTAATALVSNNNVLYVSSTGSGTQGVGYQGGARVTLSDWQSNSTPGQQDLSSVEVTPLFTNPGTNNFIPQTPATDNIGTPVNVLTDIAGTARSGTNPDPGAYEFTVSPCLNPPTPGTVIASSLSLCTGQTLDLDLTGNSVGSGQTYVWESSPSGIPGSFSPITPPSITSPYSTVLTTSTYYRAAVTCSGNTQYTPVVLAEINPPFFGGTYTIDATTPTNITGGGNNFQSFADAIAAISCGITGPVFFDVVPGTGPYNEQVVFPATITGTSASNTITINGNGNTLSYTSTDANYRGVIILDGTDYVTIDNLVITSPGAATTEYAWGVQLKGDADNNTVQNCTINLNTSSSSANYAGIVINGSATGATTGGDGDNNIISGNTITGGYYGIISVGTSGNLLDNNIISNNVVTDNYSYSIYLAYNNAATVEGNNCSRPTRPTFGSFYGVYATTGNTATTIGSNRIHDPFGGNTATTTTAYGIYISSDATLNNENKIINNLIYNFNSNGTQYGINNAGANSSWYYHNTIALEDVASTVTSSYNTRAYYMSAAATGTEFKNNIISIKRGTSSGVRYGIYIPASSASGISAEKNDYYLSSAANTFVGYDGADRATLANWQSATGLDLTSFDVDPVFSDPSTGNYAPTVAILDNAGFPVGVPTDISGTTRNTPPDIGAYEFNVQPCSVVIPGTAAGPSGICNGQNVSLSLTGYSTDAGISIQWMSSPAGQGNWQPVSGATTPNYTVTGQTTSTDYQAVVSCSNNSTQASSNIVAVPMNSFYNCYCTPVITSSGAAITSVVIQGTTLNNSTGAAPAPYYVAYPATGNTTATLVQGTTYTLDLGLAASGIASMWIDYDQNGTFDVSEWVQTGTSGASHSVTFTVPVSAQTGLTGLRIRSRSTGANAATDPCTSMATAETEDYVISIDALLPCSGTPVAGTASGPANALCAGNNVDLELTGFTIASGIDISWEQYNSTTSAWDPIPGSSAPAGFATASYTATGLTASTMFRAVVNCTNTGGGVAYSNTVAVTINNPQIVNVFPGSRCDPGPVTLAATATPSSADIQWYAAATGGIAIGTGGVFTTPSLSSTTTYYAAAKQGGAVAYVGPVNPGGLGSGGFANYDTYRTFFTVSSDLQILTVDIFPQTTGQSGTIEVYTSTNSLVASVPYTTTMSGSTTTPQTVPMSVSLSPGSYYMKMGSNAVSLYRNSAGATFPYSASGISLTGQSFSGYPYYYYYFYNWQVSFGCESPRVPVTASITGSSSGTGLAAGGTTTGAVHADGATIDYMDACNDKVATVADAAGGNVLGNTSAIVLTSSSVQTFNSSPYVPRVFDITPANSGSATVTLYVLQSEFDAYNNFVITTSASVPLLPTGPSDVAGIANIAITQYHGSALGGNTGPGGLYNASAMSFIPNSAITASSNGTYWTLTFPVTGFSGFFIHSGSWPLDIDLRSISAMNAGSRNRVDWTTATELSGDKFELERSADGRSYIKLAAMNAKGEPSSYSYWDETPVTGINYYRLRMIDGAGRASYSKVVTATVVSGSFTVSAYPNPVREMLTVKVYGKQGDHAAVMITDVTGKLIRTLPVHNGMAEVNMSGLAQGVYLVKYTDSEHSQTIKVTRQ